MESWLEDLVADVLATGRPREFGKGWPARRERPLPLPEQAPASKKDHATPKQRAGSVRATKRTTPVSFVRESAGELRKVVWPTASQLRQYFVVVLVFVLLVIAYDLLMLAVGFLTYQYVVES